MKLLLEENNKQAADEIKLLLEGNGIPVHIGNADTARNFGFVAYAQKYDIWVMIDDQYQCALALLEDESYEVKNPVNIEEFYKNNSVKSAAVFKFMWSNLVIPGIVVALMLITLLLLIYVTQVN